MSKRRKDTPPAHLVRRHDELLASGEADSAAIDLAKGVVVYQPKSDAAGRVPPERKER